MYNVANTNRTMFLRLGRARNPPENEGGEAWIVGAPTRCPAPKGNTVKTTPVIAAAATLALASALVSCSAGGGTDGDGGGGGNDATNCTNKITKTDLPVVTMWAWYPNMETVVDNFNEASD